MSDKKEYKTGDLYMWNQVTSIDESDPAVQDATYQTRSIVIKDPAFLTVIQAKSDQVLTVEEEQEILNNTEPTFKRTK